MFAEINKLSEGDEFYIHVCGETLAYKVCLIQTVFPEETGTLTIEEGRDLVTLITCTPYAINSHRLLVTAERTEYVKEAAEKVTTAGMIVHAFNPLRMTVLFTVILIVITCVVVTGGNKKKSKGAKEHEK